MVSELERVVLLTDIAEYGLKAGDIGMVVHKYGHEAGYEVEFVTLQGDLVVLATLSSDQVRRVDRDEIACVRRIHSQ